MNLDAYFTCVWLGEQARAAARDRTGAGRVEAARAIHTAMQPTKHEFVGIDSRETSLKIRMLTTMHI